MSDKKEQIKFYDDYIKRQINVGINHRHLKIFEKLEYFGIQDFDTVLEIGCGIGIVTGFIAQFGMKVVANDLSPKSIEVAADRLKNFNNIEFNSKDIMQFNSGSKFSAVVLADVLEHIPLGEHKDLFINISNLLEEHGRVFINIPYPEYLQYIIENQPEDLQELDQPVPLDLVLSNLKDSNLRLVFLEDYSIYAKPYDYRFIVLEKITSNSFESTQIKPHSLITKMKLKVSKVVKGRKY